MVGDMGSDKTFAARCGFQYVDANEFLTQNSSLKNLFYGKLSSDIDLQGSGSGFDAIHTGGEFVELVRGHATGGGHDRERQGGPLKSGTDFHSKRSLKQQIN